MIILDNVTKNYTSSVVFEKFSLHVEHGEFLFVTGESGSGKSTLIKLLTKETDVTKGRILVDGKDLSKMKRRDVPVYRRNLGIVFQDMKLLGQDGVRESCLCEGSDIRLQKGYEPESGIHPEPPGSYKAA